MKTTTSTTATASLPMWSWRAQTSGWMEPVDEWAGGRGTGARALYSDRSERRREDSANAPLGPARRRRRGHSGWGGGRREGGARLATQRRKQNQTRPAQGRVESTTRARANFAKQLTWPEQSAASERFIVSSIFAPSLATHPIKIKKQT